MTVNIPSTWKFKSFVGYFHIEIPSFSAVTVSLVLPSFLNPLAYVVPMLPMWSDPLWVTYNSF